jgi:hypothetical protein
MDRKYIIEHNLMEAHKQFMRLSEGYLATSLAEDDDENQPDNGMEPGGGEPAPIGQGGGENTQIGNQNGMDMQGSDNMGAQEPDGTETQGPDNIGGGEGLDDFGPAPEMDDLDTEESDDDVIDVEQLTQAQEKLNKKQNSIGHDLGDVDDRIIALLTAVEKIKGSIDKNNEDIASLKQELEKRVPTDTEKLNMQSLKMYPYNVSPNDYWDEKTKEGRYDTGNGEEKKEYKITNDDVNNYTDRDIENSFDDELNQTMKDIFKGF